MKSWQAGEEARVEGDKGKGEAPWQSEAPGPRGGEGVRRRLQQGAGGGPAETRHGARRVWYSQAGLRSQMAAAAWGDVSMRLQIDGGR